MIHYGIDVAILAACALAYLGLAVVICKLFDMDEEQGNLVLMTTAIACGSMVVAYAIMVAILNAML